MLKHIVNQSELKICSLQHKNNHHKLHSPVTDSHSTSLTWKATLKCLEKKKILYLFQTVQTTQVIYIQSGPIKSKSHILETAKLFLHKSTIPKFFITKLRADDCVGKCNQITKFRENQFSWCFPTSRCSIMATKSRILLFSWPPCTADCWNVAKVHCNKIVNDENYCFYGEQHTDSRGVGSNLVVGGPWRTREREPITGV